MIGINVSQNGPPRIAPAARLADVGRIPWARGPYYGLDALPGSFDRTNAMLIAPEHRLQTSLRRVPARIVDGSYGKRILGYLDSIPARWVVGITYWHEPNGEIADGTFSAELFKAAWYRIGRLISRSSSRARLVPRHLLVWEGNGLQFDQSFVTKALRDTLRAYFTSSP